MDITPHQLKILKAEICPYCLSETKIVDEAFIYGKTYKGRNIYCCVKYPKCDAYVGSHEDGLPLGRLADKRLRGFKNSAHKYFDKIWQEGLKDRSELYSDLSIYLKIPPHFTHIGMFQEHTCKRVIYWAINIYQKLLVDKVKNNQMNKAKEKLLNNLGN